METMLDDSDDWDLELLDQIILKAEEENKVKQAAKYGTAQQTAPLPIATQPALPLSAQQRQVVGPLMAGLSGQAAAHFQRQPETLGPQQPLQKEHRPTLVQQLASHVLQQPKQQENVRLEPQAHALAQQQQLHNVDGPSTVQDLPVLREPLVHNLAPALLSEAAPLNRDRNGARPFQGMRNGSSPQLRLHQVAQQIEAAPPMQQLQQQQQQRQVSSFQGKQTPVHSARAPFSQRSNGTQQQLSSQGRVQLPIRQPGEMHQQAHLAQTSESVPRGQSSEGAQPGQPLANGHLPSDQRGRPPPGPANQPQSHLQQKGSRASASQPATWQHAMPPPHPQQLPGQVHAYKAYPGVPPLNSAKPPSGEPPASSLTGVPPGGDAALLTPEMSSLRFEAERLRESLAEKDGAVSILRSRLAQADQELFELRRIASGGSQPQAARQSAELQREVDRLGSQLAFQEEEMMEAKRLRAEKEGQLQEARAKMADLQAQLEATRKQLRQEEEACAHPSSALQPPGPGAAVPLVGLTLAASPLDHPANGNQAAPNAKHSPERQTRSPAKRYNSAAIEHPGGARKGKPGGARAQDPWCPPFPSETGSSQREAGGSTERGRASPGGSQGGKRRRGGATGWKESPLKQRLIRGALLPRGGQRQGSGEPSVGPSEKSNGYTQASQQPPAQHAAAEQSAPRPSAPSAPPANDNCPQEGKVQAAAPGVTPGGRATSAADPEQGSLEMAEVSRALRQLWARDGAPLEGARLVSKLYGACSEEIYHLLAGGERGEASHDERETAKGARGGKGAGGGGGGGGGRYQEGGLASGMGVEGQRGEQGGVGTMLGGSTRRSPQRVDVPAAEVSESERLHEALAKVMNGLEPAAALLGPLLALCTSSSEDRAECAASVLRNVLRCSPTCRQRILHSQGCLDGWRDYGVALGLEQAAWGRGWSVALPGACQNSREEANKVSESLAGNRSRNCAGSSADVQAEGLPVFASPRIRCHVMGTASPSVSADRRDGVGPGATRDEPGGPSENRAENCAGNGVACCGSGGQAEARAPAGSTEKGVGSGGVRVGVGIRDLEGAERGGLRAGAEAAAAAAAGSGNRVPETALCSDPSAMDVDRATDGAGGGLGEGIPERPILGRQPEPGTGAATGRTVSGGQGRGAGPVGRQTERPNAGRGVGGGMVAGEQEGGQGDRAWREWSGVAALVRVAEEGAGEGAQREAIGSITLLVAHAEALEERHRFGELVTAGAATRLLGSAKGPGVRSQALHLLLLLIRCPSLLALLDWPQPAGGEEEGRDARWQSSDAAALVQAVAACLLHSGWSPPDYAVRRGAVRVLAYLATSGPASWTALLRIGASSAEQPNAAQGEEGVGGSGGDPSRDEKEGLGLGNEEGSGLAGGRGGVGNAERARGEGKGRDKARRGSGEGGADGSRGTPPGSWARGMDGLDGRRRRSSSTGETLPVLLLMLLDLELQLEEGRWGGDATASGEAASEQRSLLMGEAMALLCELVSHPQHGGLTLGGLASSRALTRTCFSIADRVLRCADGEDNGNSSGREMAERGHADLAELARGFQRKVASYGPASQECS